MSNYYEPTESINQGLQASENKLVNRALTALPIPYISGLKLEEDISLGNLTFNKIDSNGVVWVCTDIDGWWNLPDPEFPDLDRGWGDGSYDSNGRYASRVLTLSGSFLTQNPEQAVIARQTLIDAVNLVYKGALLVVNESTPKSTFVRISGKPDIVSSKARGRHDFSIGLKAADPIKYEYVENTYRTVTIAAGASQTLENIGNTKTPVLFDLSGTISGGTLTNTYTDENDDEITETIGGITKASTAYTTRIDTYNRAVIRTNTSTGVATSSRSDINTFVQWIHLHPGNNLISFTASGGTSPSCVVNYRSGWIG
jgi:hypothetical protein